MKMDIRDTLATCSPNLNVPSYDPKSITAGIVHIGVGNFHRAHQAYYTDKFLNLSNHAEWGIIGIGITVSGKQMAQRFIQQEGLYTLTEYHPDGSSSISIVGSIIDYIPAKEDTEAAIECMADPKIKIVSLTITEGGYKLNEAGEFQLNDAAIVHDLENPHAPQTAFGYIIEALARRKQRGIGPLTILSCDNLPHNGDAARKAFLAFAEAVDSGLASWIGSNVSFPNSMVDRITPATGDDDRLRLNIESGVRDAIPVFCESFTQWIIEDRFCAGRPQWEMAGVKFVKDVSPYETLKLRFLNASHSMLAYPAFLAGYRRVDEAMQDSLFHHYLKTFMDLDVSPLIDVPADIDLKLYKGQLLERFANPAVSDQLSRLCYHGGAKIPTFILPTLQLMLKKNMDPVRIAFLVAAYGHYLKTKEDDKGQSFEVRAPKLNEEDWKKVNDADDLLFLAISPFQFMPLTEHKRFVKLYMDLRSTIRKNGVIATLREVNSK